MNEPLLATLTAFRDIFREYMEICRKRSGEVLQYGRALRVEDHDRETELRRQLQRRLGAIQPQLDRLPHVGWWYTNVATRVGYNILDNALNEIGMQQPGVLHLAAGALEKAVGAVEAMGPEEIAALSGGGQRLFLSYSYRPENDPIVNDIREVAQALDFEVIEGEVPRPGSVSAKVQSLIGHSSVVVALMTVEAEANPPGVSEWVRQEAVYALGLGKPVVRLVEEGADTEGRIFGDAEYVPLSRANPWTRDGAPGANAVWTASVSRRMRCGSRPARRQGDHARQSQLTSLQIRTRS